MHFFARLCGWLLIPTLAAVPLFARPQAPPAAAPQAASAIFPFDVEQRTLENGLKIVAIPYDNPGIVSFYIVIRTGSRDEVEPGHSGFAHFFEHMMFRGTQRYPPDRYNDALKQLGADANAYTSDDRTVYHMTGPASGFETMVEIEADRFQHLDYSEDAFRTEALAVLGEYNKSASNPFLALEERLRELAFTKHTYRHTTLGFLEDIQAMPGYYEYSLSFFNRFYRPDNATVIAVGDIQPERVFEVVSSQFGEWTRAYAPPQIETEPPQTERRTAHIEWPNPTRPYLMFGYHVPAFSTRTVDFPVLDVISELLFSQSAPLYREVVIENHWADFISGGAVDHRDPYLFTIAARAQSDASLQPLTGAIDRHLARLQSEPIDAERLARTASHLRYQFALSMDTPDEIANRVSHYIALTGSVETINELFERYQEITPADVQRVARQTFRPENETRVTLSSLAGPTLSAQTSAPAEPGSRQGGLELVTLEIPDTPLVSIRLMFRAGSIHDPAGKEGLSALTAMMIGSSGTAKRTYSELIDALYPMAANIGVSTDREIVVFATQVHRDALSQFTPLVLEAVLEPGFREEDFTRNREQLLAYLTTTLRSANDELLGLELIQQKIFADHPYGHAPAGTVEGLRRLTMDDVRAFYREHYTRANLILGVGGGYPAELPDSLARSLAALPAGQAARQPLPAAPAVRGRHVTIVDKQAESTGVHFGYPLPLTRKDEAFYPLLVANSFLGEHRTFHGRLMNELRGKRGLNYGDYSYIEYWDNPPGTTSPPPNHPRRQQYFSVWVRPVVPDHGVFALRAAIAEVDRLVERGLTAEEFELTRDFLIRYSKLWAQSLSDRLAFHMDSRFYDMPYFIDRIEAELKDLTVEEVNAAARQYIQTEHFQAVLIANAAAALADRLRAGEPSPITYANPVAEDVTIADRTIAVLPIDPASISIVPVAETFGSRR